MAVIIHRHFRLFIIHFTNEDVIMSAKRFITQIHQLMWLAMLASLTVWSSAIFAACDTITNGLVACYPFDGNANDASGNGNNGTVNEAVLTEDRLGNPNAAYNFNGVSSFIKVPHKPQLNANSSGFSVVLWFKPATTQNPIYALIDKSHGGIDNTSWVIQWANDGINGTNSFMFALGNGTQFVVASNPHVPDNNWHFAVANFDGSTIKFYLNGTLVRTEQFSGTLASNSRDMLIGTWWYGNRFFKGDIDDVGIYNRVLSEAEIKQLYEEANSCTPANYTNGVLQVPAIQIEGITDVYKATLQQYSSSFAFRVTQSAIVTGKKSSCPATYSTKTGIGVLHIPLVKTKTTLPPNTPQCYDVTLQEFSNRFQLDLEQVKLTPCP